MDLYRIGRCVLLKNDFISALGFFYDALNCPDGIVNPFILLRLGQCLFEQKDLKKAKEYLFRAYMLEGNKIFKDEPGKYFDEN